VIVELKDKTRLNVRFEFIPTNPPKIIMKSVRKIIDEGNERHPISQRVEG